MRHFLFAFCWLLISVSDSADEGEILDHWAGCAVISFFSLRLSPPGPAASSLSPASPSTSCQSPSLLVAVHLGVGFVSVQEMAAGSWSQTCAWVSAGIQPLGPVLDQLPKHTHLPGLERSLGGDEGWQRNGRQGVGEGRGGKGCQEWQCTATKVVQAGTKGPDPGDRRVWRKQGDRFSASSIPACLLPPPVSFCLSAMTSARPPGAMCSFTSPLSRGAVCWHRGMPCDHIKASTPYSCLIPQAHRSEIYHPSKLG